jgi:uncharacterized protein (TIGR02996 family)
MSEESAFLEALKANPADDTARLVYADWLDEHGEPQKAEYLRLVAAIALREDRLEVAGESQSLLVAAKALPEDWRAAAGSRFSLILDRWTTDKIRAIKWIREVTGDGLAEAKDASERLPHTLFQCARYELAWGVHASALRVGNLEVRIASCPTDLPPADAVYEIGATFHIFTAPPRRRGMAAQAGRDARAALAAALASAGIDGAEAVAQARTGEWAVVASGLTLQQARDRVFALGHLLPPFDSSRGWAIWISRRVTPTAPTQE